MNQHFPPLPIFLFPPCQALVRNHWDRQSILCLLWHPQLPWLVTTVLIEETSSLVKPWLVTAGNIRLECAIFHTKYVFHNNNLYEQLQGSPPHQCLPIVQEQANSTNQRTSSSHRRDNQHGNVCLLSFIMSLRNFPFPLQCCLYFQPEQSSF